MGDKVKALKKENDDLKSQLNDLKKEYQFLKSKMAEQKDYNETAATALPSTQDVQFLSDSYDALVKSESSLSKALDNFSRRLDLLTVKVDRIDQAIDEMLYYSYQYNLKIMGVPLISDRESAQDTAELCVKLFTGLGVDILLSDIDIAHRVPQRNTSSGNGNRSRPNPIICKFTRRMIRDKVLASRGNTSRITTECLDLPSSAEINRIAIYSHLTPRLQELLFSAKLHQNTYSYKWCWAKGAAIFLRKTDTSMAIRLGSIDDLTKLRLRECPEARSEDPCS